jgi:hypothetical protein
VERGRLGCPLESLRAAEGGKSDRMTRFKELRRIEDAIEHKNRTELQWALGYCRMRLGIASRKEHEKHWRKIEAKVRRALESSKCPLPNWLSAGLFPALHLESSVPLSPASLANNDRRRIRFDPALYTPGDGPHLER